MKRREAENNFWISYSDLATGLMMVFMVVMLMMVVISKFEAEKQANEAAAAKRAVIRQKEQLQKVVREIETILGSKSSLAKAINTAFEGHPELGVAADPVTAKLQLSKKRLQFAENKSDIEEDGKVFLNEFAPRYVCALYLQDRIRCRRTRSCARSLPSENRAGATRNHEDYPDPAAVNTIRRILVAGHADMVGRLAFNHKLSAERAESVVSRMLAVLDCAVHNALKTPDDERPPRCVATRRNRTDDGKIEAHLPLAVLPEACLKRVDPRAIYNYARDRLVAVGDGDTDHARSLIRSGLRGHHFRAGFDSLDDERPSDGFKKPEFRRVTLGLEMTGDDMTALLLNVRLLQAELDADSGAADPFTPLAGLVLAVADGCRRHPNSYHGCDAFRRYCRRFAERAASRGTKGNLPPICVQSDKSARRKDRDDMKHEVGNP